MNIYTYMYTHITYIYLPTYTCTINLTAPTDPLALARPATQRHSKQVVYSMKTRAVALYVRVYVCMCVCVCVCVYVCVYTYIYRHSNAFETRRVLNDFASRCPTCVFVRVLVCVCAYIYTYMYIQKIKCI